MKTIIYPIELIAFGIILCALHFVLGEGADYLTWRRWRFVFAVEPVAQLLDLPGGRLLDLDAHAAS